jgi:TfoX/Sxy family transcriptional regulator of competence genes
LSDFRDWEDFILLLKETKMPVNEELAHRLREAMEPISRVKEKKMFGGIAFMVNGKMCINAGSDYLMVRIDPVDYEELIEKPGCSPVVMRGRDIKGFVYVDEEVLHTKKQLDYWVRLALAFNPKARSSKK